MVSEQLADRQFVSWRADSTRSRPGTGTAVGEAERCLFSENSRAALPQGYIPTADACTGAPQPSRQPAIDTTRAPAAHDVFCTKQSQRHTWRRQLVGRMHVHRAETHATTLYLNVHARHLRQPLLPNAYCTRQAII